MVGDRGGDAGGVISTLESCLANAGEGGLERLRPRKAGVFPASRPAGGKQHHRFRAKAITTPAPIMVTTGLTATVLILPLVPRRPG